MPPTLLRSVPPQSTTSPGRTAAGWVAAALAALAVAVGAGEVLEPPSTVDLVVVNDSARDVTVAVTAVGSGRLLPVATLDPGEERPVVGVIDQGGDWVFSIGSIGEPVRTLEMTADELDAAGLVVTVPAGPGDVGDGGTQG